MEEEKEKVSNGSDKDNSIKWREVKVRRRGENSQLAFERRFFQVKKGQRKCCQGDDRSEKTGKDG